MPCSCLLICTDRFKPDTIAAVCKDGATDVIVVRGPIFVDSVVVVLGQIATKHFCEVEPCPTTNQITMVKLFNQLAHGFGVTAFGRLSQPLLRVFASAQSFGKLIWHSLGAKTIELIHQNVHVDAVRDDLDTLVLDADLLEAVLSNPDPKKAKEIEIKLSRRMRKHAGNPKFKQLSERLDALKDRFESGQVNSVEFLKQLLEIAKETLQAEKDVPSEEDEDRGKAALTELFNEVKTSETPIMVERVVADIDEIVRLVRFPGWQGTQAGEREVKKALRKALFKYKLHADEELFEKAYSYIRQYY